MKGTHVIATCTWIGVGELATESITLCGGASSSCRCCSAAPLRSVPGGSSLQRHGVRKSHGWLKKRPDIQRAS